MKKLFIGIISLTLVMSTIVFADDVIELFNLNTLGVVAVENSITIDSKEITLENKKLDLEEVEDAILNASQVGGDRVTYINNRIKVESDPIVAAMEVWKAEKAIEKAEVDLKNDAYKKGMTYLLLKDELALNKTLLENLNYYLDNVQIKVDLGTAISTDLVNKKIEVQTQEMKILELEASIDAIVIEMNHLIGNSLDAQFNLDDEIVALDYALYDVSKMYEENQASYSDIYEKTVLLEARTIEFDLYASKYVEEDKEYKIALYNKLAAEINLEEAKNSYEIALKTAYNKYLSAFDSYKLSLKQLELNGKLLEESQLKYELGLVNAEDLRKAEESKLKAEYAVKESVVAFNTAKIDLLNLK